MLSDSSTVPPELLGREVSLRTIGPLIQGAARLGVSPETLARGTGYTVAQLRDRRERVAWSVFAVFVENLGREMSDDQLIALGGEMLDNPIHRAVLLPGRLLFSLTDIYRWGAGPEGPLAQLLVVQDMSVTSVDEHTLLFETRMKPGYSCPRTFWYLRLGFLRSVSRAFGLQAAEVTLTITPDGSSYRIVLPRVAGLLTRLRRRASWLVATQEAATTLKRANEDLHERYLEIQREVEARMEVEAQLRVLNSELETRVRERTSELETANRDLGAANAELTMFGATVAHDLRAPVRAIHGFSTILVEDYGEQLDPEAHKHLARIIGGAERMTARIDALLSLTRITRTEVRRQALDLGEIARSVLDELRAAQPAREVEIVMSERLDASADPALIRALMENLLGNAWKFTKNRSPARISVTRTEAAPADVYCIRDNGAGFDLAHSADLFAPFRRAHSTKEFEGTGIGLAIVDRIVRRHGGKIWFDAAPDRGAAFSFTLRADTEADVTTQA